MNAAMGITNKNVGSSVKQFFGYNNPVKNIGSSMTNIISKNIGSSSSSSITNTLSKNSTSGSYTTLFVFIGLFVIIFICIYIYFKTFGYTLQMGWDKLSSVFQNKEQIDTSLNNGTSSNITASLVPPSDIEESAKLKDMLGLAKESSGQLPFNPEERPSGMPGSKESPDFFEKVNRKIKKAFDPEKQIFNISRNVYTYDDAAPLCKAMGAELATYEQIVEAQQHGADWCNYGWIKGQMAVFPVQEKTWNKLQTGPQEYRNACGKPGINGGFFDNPELPGTSSALRRTDQTRSTIPCCTISPVAVSSAESREFWR